MMLMTLMRVERFGGGQLTIGDEKLFLCPRLCCAVWQYRGAYRQQRIRKVTRLGACRYVPRLCRESTIVHDERVHLSMTKSTLLLLFPPLSSPPCLIPSLLSLPSLRLFRPPKDPESAQLALSTTRLPATRIFQSNLCSSMPPALSCRNTNRLRRQSKKH